jgi:hypothetical protein
VTASARPKSPSWLPAPRRWPTWSAPKAALRWPRCLAARLEEAKYDAKYPNQFQVYSPYTYDATFLLVDAMKRANSVDPKVYTLSCEVQLQGRDFHDPV